MNLYLVLGTSAHPAELAGTQADAKRMARERGTSWEPYEVPVDKAGLMAHLNAMLADINAEMHMVKHVDFEEIRQSNTPEAQLAAREIANGNYTAISIANDEEFDKLPIARQLDFAARAMENARDAL